MQAIADWLEKLGMSEYAQRFAENRIDLSVLPDLTDQHLKDLGIALGDRLKMLRAIRELSGAVLASPQPAFTEPKPQDTAERRQVTVMFSDLVGSTALSARMDPEDLREVISAYQKCVARVVERFGGFVAKYMGDGVLVYFGYPQAHEDDGERAVRAGLELIQAVIALKSSTSLQARVGIATGLVVVGDLIGEGSAQEQAVVGETPNLAARLQGIAEPNMVVIAESTRKLLGNLFELDQLGARDLKGIDGPSPAWAVLRASSVESRFQALRTAMTPLVGRDEEIELLMRRWAQAKAGEGCVVLISGEPGIGKSRIAETMQERVGVEPHTRLRFFCSSYHQDSALYPAIAQLERAAGFRREDTADQRLDKLETLLVQATNDISELGPLFADLLSIPTGSRYPALTLTPQKRKEKTLAALLSQVEGLSAREPVLMVFEDIHWSDPTTRESLDLLIDRVPRLRVLVIITFRPEFTPLWVGRPHVTLLSLNRLPPRQRAEMIAYVTGGKALPKEIADQIIDRTDGVPLFIEELTKSVVESGLVTETGDRYAAAGPVAPLAIPTSLHASLLARLDHLAPTREVVQIGAALGRSFSHELISAVATMPRHKLDDALEQLVHAELLFQRGTLPDAEYTFKHALVQDAAYSTLLRSRRQQLHGRIAATLESQFAEIVAAQPQLVAQHCAEAGLTEKAISYWLKAGQQALARSAMTEAVSQLQKGLDLLASLPDNAWRRQQELDLQISIAQAWLATKGYAAPAAAEAYARARALAEQLERPDYLAPLLHGLWAFHLNRGELKLALALAEQMEMLGKAHANISASLLGKEEHGIASFYRGEFTTARALFEQCHGLSDPAHRAVCAAWVIQDQHVQTLAFLALTLGCQGYIDQGRARLNEALTEARELRHALTLAVALLFAAFFERENGSPHEAHRYAKELVALSNEHGFPLFVGWGNLLQGHSLTALGLAQEGLDLITKSISVCRAIGAELNVPRLLTMRADAYGALGRPLEGLRSLDEAAHIIDTTEERRTEADMFRLRGELLLAAGDRVMAEHSYREALAIATRQGARMYELRAASCLARLWRDQRKRAEARDLLAPIYGWFTEGFDTLDLKQAKALLVELAA